MTVNGQHKDRIANKRTHIRYEEFMSKLIKLNTVTYVVKDQTINLDFYVGSD
jgi:hypothetical protein